MGSVRNEVEWLILDGCDLLSTINEYQRVLEIFGMYDLLAMPPRCLMQKPGLPYVSPAISLYLIILWIF